MSELNSCHRDFMAHQAWNNYYLALYRKSIPITFYIILIWLKFSLIVKAHPPFHQRSIWALAVCTLYFNKTLQKPIIKLTVQKKKRPFNFYSIYLWYPFRENLVIRVTFISSNLTRVRRLSKWGTIPTQQLMIMSKAFTRAGHAHRIPQRPFTQTEKPEIKGRGGDESHVTRGVMLLEVILGYSLGKRQAQLILKYSI